jgi:hypothetical protein
MWIMVFFIWFCDFWGGKCFQVLPLEGLSYYDGFFLKLSSIVEGTSEQEIEAGMFCHLMCV